MSTGGGTLKDVKRAVKNIMSINKNLAILHCTASYPCKIEDMNLNIITTYLKKFPKNLIGISDHENGIDVKLQLLTCLVQEYLKNISH